MDTEKHDTNCVKFAGHLAKLIDECAMTQLEIARKLGYQSPNVISMFKLGMMKVPLSKVPALAKLLGVDPATLMRMAVREYEPALLYIIDDIFERATQPVISNGRSGQIGVA